MTRYRIMNGDRKLAGSYAKRETADRKVARLNEYTKSTGKGRPYRVKTEHVRE